MCFLISMKIKFCHLENLCVRQFYKIQVYAATSEIYS